MYGQYYIEFKSSNPGNTFIILFICIVQIKSKLHLDMVSNENSL